MRNHFLKTKKKEKTGKRKSNDLKLCVTAAAAANKNTSSVESFRKINQWILNDFSYKIYEDWLKIVFFFFYRLEIAQNPSNDKSVGCLTVITLHSNELPVQSGALKCLMITRQKLNQERKKENGKLRIATQFHCCISKTKMPNWIHFLFRGILQLRDARDKVIGEKIKFHEYFNVQKKLWHFIHKQKVMCV